MLAKSPFTFFFQLIWLEFPKRTLLLSALSVSAMGLISLEPMLLRELISALDAPFVNSVSVVSLFAGIAGVWFLALAANRIRDFVELKTSPDLRMMAQLRIYEWLDHHNAEFFRSHHSANLAQKVKQAGTAVLALIDIIFDHQIRLLTAVVMAIWTLSAVPSYFLLTLFVWLALFLPLAWWFARRVLPLSQGFGEAASRSSGVVADIVSNIRTVQAFNQVYAERKVVRQSLEAEKAASLRVRWFLIAMNTGLYGSQIIFQAAFVGRSDHALLGRGIGSPELVMVTSLSAILLSSVWGVAQQLQGFYDQSGILKAALSTVAQPHAIADIENASPLVCQEGRIELKSLDFAYGSRRVFSNLSLVIEPQEKVGLVGPSGAGKSTLFKLLQRELDPSHGSILIDGQDLRAVNRDSLLLAIAEVPQEPALFHRTLRENILYGKPSASQTDLTRAIQRARCEDFINSQPHGLDTVVGERGLRLSGGERQRIALARAFLKDSPIVLLDEATSAIDSQNEAEIQRAIHELCVHRTLIVIAHRLSTVQAMDRIIVFDQGRVVDCANHTTLLARCGLYVSLWGHQSQGA